LAEVLHPLFLPYTADDLKQHFVLADLEGEDPERFLKKWRERIAQAPTKDPSFLHRDETLWTAGALLAIHRHPDQQKLWREVMVSLFGPVSPTPERLEWSDLVAGELRLFFEVGLPSPEPYRRWLSEHLDDRHALHTQKGTSAARALALEGRTHLDAMLLGVETHFAVHFEAKVLSDIDTKTTHDPLRNQLARNIDCLLNPPGKQAQISKRDPNRSFLVMLTPELFRRHWRSRLYGHLVREYARDAAAIQRDLPHLDGLRCMQMARRIGWLCFEDLRALEPSACPWLAEPKGTA
jgi:hypothetical protein